MTDFFYSESVHINTIISACWFLLSSHFQCKQAERKQIKTKQLKAILQYWWTIDWCSASEWNGNFMSETPH